MLSKKNRLTKSSSFKATYCQNRVVSDEFFVLFAGKNKQKDDIETKIGFVVSKKIDKRATVRNKIKRQLRAILRQNLNTFVGAKNYVIVAKPSIVDLTYQQIEKEILISMSKIKRED